MTITPSSLSSMPAGCTATVSATGLPSGLSLNASTGVITGTPTSATTSSVTVTYTVKDNAGATKSTSPATSTFTITAYAPLTPSQVLGAATSANTGAWAWAMVDTTLSYGASYFDYYSGSGTNTTLPGLSSATNCPSGGSYTASWFQATSGFVTVSDYVTVTYANCAINSAVTLNGSATHTLTSILTGQSRTYTNTYSALTIAVNSRGTVSVPNGQVATYLTPASSSTYPMTYISSAASASLGVTATSAQYASGTYSLTSPTRNDIYSSATAHTITGSGTESDGTYSNVSLTSVTGITRISTSGTWSTSVFPVNTVGYNGASITATTTSASTTTLSGTNNNNASIASQALSFAYFY